MTLDAIIEQEEETQIFGGGAKALLPGYRENIPKGAPLRIPNLRSGDYELRIQGKGLTPLLRKVSLRDAALDLGTVRLRGTGTISGDLRSIHEAGKPWRFARGEVRARPGGEGKRGTLQGARAGEGAGE